MASTARLLKPLISTTGLSQYFPFPLLAIAVPIPFSKKPVTQVLAAKMATSGAENKPYYTKVIDSHLHVWASPQEVKVEPFIGLETTLFYY